MCELLGVVNCGKINIWGKLMEGKGYLVRFIIQIPLGVVSEIIRVSSHLQ